MGKRAILGLALLLSACATPQLSQAPPQIVADNPAIKLGSAEQQTATAIARIEQLNPQLRAVIAIDPTSMEQARRVDSSAHGGPLAGKPVLIKDNIESAGPLPTTAGSLALITNVTNRDAPLVARLRQSGAVIVGKANLSEWANIRSSDSISGWSAVGGQDSQPLCARSQRLRVIDRKRGRGRHRDGPAGDRHGNRRIGHLPGRDHRSRRE
jgi:amidase